MSIEARRAPQLLLPRGGVELRAAILWALWDQNDRLRFSGHNGFRNSHKYLNSINEYGTPGGIREPASLASASWPKATSRTPDPCVTPTGRIVVPLHENGLRERGKAQQFQSGPILMTHGQRDSNIVGKWVFFLAHPASAAAARAGLRRSRKAKAPSRRLSIGVPSL